MRILCLHGQGASPEIMESQLTSIRTQLQGNWEFEFVEAPNETAPAEELKDIYDGGQHYCFFDRYTPSAMSEAVSYVRETVEEDGPFDGLVGFSQGASVAAAYLASDLLSTASTSIRFAVFLCAALVPPSAATKNALKASIGSFGHVDIPTLHVIGERDLCYNQSVELVKSCEGTLATTLFHPGGHAVPRDSLSCQKIARGIEAASRAALSRH